MITLSASEAKKHLLEMIRSGDENFDRYLITRNGEPKAVLMSVDDYEGWLETLEILSSQKAMAEIRKARQELDRGRGVPFAKILATVRES